MYVDRKLGENIISIKLLPFYKTDDNFYKVDKDTLIKKTEFYFKYCINELNSISQNHFGYSIGSTNEDLLNIELNDFYELNDGDCDPYELGRIEVLLNLVENFLQMINDLINFRISQNDFDDYLNHQVENYSIKKYKKIKNKFKYALQEYCMYGTESRNLDKFKYLKKESDEFVLNRNNPFADVSIKNQKFLYPTKDKEFQTLSFNIGYSIGKQTKENSESIVLTPNFKIQKSKDRSSSNTNIVMDDTISSPILKLDDDKEFLYI